MSSKVPLIVVIDEDGPSVRESKQLLESECPQAVVMSMATAYRSREFLKNEDLTLIVTELAFGDGYTGKNLIADVRQMHSSKNIPILVLTKRPPTEQETKDLSRFNVTITSKPLELAFLRSFISRNPSILGSQETAITKITVPKGQYLFRENDKGDSFFIVQTGKLEALKQSNSLGPQREVLIAEILPGQVVGEMSVLDGSARSLSVRAKEDSLLLELRAADLRTYLSHQPSWLRILIESVLEKLRRMNDGFALRSPL